MGTFIFLFCIICRLLCSACSIITLPIYHAQVAGKILLALSVSTCLTFLMLKETDIVLDTVLWQFTRSVLEHYYIKLQCNTELLLLSHALSSKGQMLPFSPFFFSNRLKKYQLTTALKKTYKCNVPLQNYKVINQIFATQKWP